MPPIGLPKCSTGRPGTRAFICTSLLPAPPGSTWERFFRDVTQNRLRRGTFRNQEELILDIGTYNDRHNESPKPLIWTARAADILEKVKRARRALNRSQSA